MHARVGDIDGQPVVWLENDHLRVGVTPGVGGRVVSVYNKPLRHEFLWTNRTLPLRRHPPGSVYDPNFYGGIDELLPNDPPETVDGLSLPDHGELWTQSLAWTVEGDALRLTGVLPVTGLRYERTMRLLPDEPALQVDYRITNTAASRRHFMWKLHAAIAIAPGDRVVCPAGTGRIVDPAWTRWRGRDQFPWPYVDGARADIVPPADGTVDFLCLTDLNRGEIALQRPSTGAEFRYGFDTAVFPSAWLFASYGGFDGHYTAVLEPCTLVDARVNDAIARGRGGALAPGRTLKTTVTLWAGILRTPAATS